MEDAHSTAGLWIEERHLLDHLSDGRELVLAALAEGRLRVRTSDDVSLVSAADVDALLREAASPLASNLEDDRFREDTVQRQFQRANHLAQLGTMAMSVGHEINNPLTYVVANNDYIQEELAPILSGAVSDNAVAAEAVVELSALLKEMQEGVGHIQRVVAEISGLARPVKDASVVHVREAIEAALRMASPALNESVHVQLDLSATRAVRLNASALTQVLINLITNAAHAVQGMREPSVTVRCRESGEDVVIEVIDNGGGIRPEVMKRVFEAFYTTKAVGEGTGLGLAVCRRIVRDVGGEVALSSILGEGTTARVTLPVDDTAETEALPHQNLAALEGCRVLVVDDQPIVLRTVERVLRRLGVVTTLESSSADAVKRIQEDDYDAVLCDLMMPTLTGMGVYRAVIEERPELAARFVFMSGGPSSEEARAFSAAHAERVAVKPFDPVQMAAVLVRACQRSPVVFDPCPNISGCQMFPRFKADHMLRIYMQTYCEPLDGTHLRCARYCSMKSGVRPPPTLLPHGEHLPENSAG